MTALLADNWTSGQEDKWTSGQEDKWTNPRPPFQDLTTGWNQPESDNHYARWMALHMQNAIIRVAQYLWERDCTCIMATWRPSPIYAVHP